MDTSSSAHMAFMILNMRLGRDDSQIQREAGVKVLMILGGHRNILFVTKVRILFLLDHKVPQVMLAIESNLEHIVQSLSNTVSFWCSFLDPHLTTQHSNVGV